MSGLHNRFKDADWFGTNQDIILVGLGGIGRGTAEQLCLLGHKLIIYETDIIEEHNCIPQGYFPNQIGLTKAQAFVSTIKNYNHPEPEIMTGKYQEDGMVSPIMISCVDNMEARKNMFNNWIQQEDRELFIDGRMLAEYFEVYTVTPENEELYKNTLFDDSEVPTENCTYKQTRFVASIIHGTIVQMFNNWLSNKTFGIKARSLPFKLVYNGVFGELETE